MFVNEENSKFNTILCLNNDHSFNMLSLDTALSVLELKDRPMYKDAVKETIKVLADFKFQTRHICTMFEEWDDAFLTAFLTSLDKVRRKPIYRYQGCASMATLKNQAHQFALLLFVVFDLQVEE